MFKRFSWCFLLLVAAGGMWRLGAMTDQQSLIGVWEVDFAATAKLEGAQLDPLHVVMLKELGVNYTVRIGPNREFAMVNHLGETEVEGRWRAVPETQTANQRVMMVDDPAGAEVFGFVWTLLDENQLRARFPGGDTFVFRRSG